MTKFYLIVLQIPPAADFLWGPRMLICPMLHVCEDTARQMQGPLN